MKRTAPPLTDAERGVWERAWQRTYKRGTRAGDPAEDVRASAREAAWAAVERLRAGGGEEDHGRHRMPAEQRGLQGRERADAVAALSIDSELYARILARADAAGTTPRLWAESVLRRALRGRADVPRPGSRTTS